ncbi:hypothetical protein, partial [Mesorhizobium sp. M7A.F.Ca.CA.003.01.2.1]|uniref:hypothetical protein n=1 Tax=Mesorhizobium sp. M7A.F.Ca.CA.003.01.2.1 TaxID=2496722 RepID=UPI0019CFD51C
GKSSTGQEAGSESCGETGSEEGGTRQGSGKAGCQGGTGQEACSESCGETRSEEGSSTCQETGCQGCTSQEAGCQGCSGKEGCGSEIFSAGEESGTCGQAEGSAREGRQEVVALPSPGAVPKQSRAGASQGAPLVV